MVGAFYIRTAIRRLSEFSACLIPAIPVTSTPTTPGSPGAVVASSPTVIGSSSSSATPVPAASAALVVSAVLVGVARRVAVSWTVVLGPSMWRWLLVMAAVASAVSAAAAASPRVPSLGPVSIRAVVHTWGCRIVPRWPSTHVRWGNIAWGYVCSKGVWAVVAGVGYLASTSPASPASTTAVRMEWCSSE